MSNCILRPAGTEGDKTHYKCKECGRPLAVASSVPVERIRRQCKIETEATPANILDELPADSRKLLGDRIKDLTDALGIPTCGGCEARRQWLNKADAWIRARWG